MNAISELKNRYRNCGRMRFEEMQDTDDNLPSGWIKVRMTFNCEREIGIGRVRGEAEEMAATKILLKMFLNDIDTPRYKMGLIIIKRILEKFEWNEGYVSRYDMIFDTQEFEKIIIELGYKLKIHAQRGEQENVVVISIQRGPDIIETEIGRENLEDLQLKVMIRIMRSTVRYLEEQINE